MRHRKGNWTDLFASHGLALDAKKVWLGFIATLGTLAVIFLVGLVYNLAVGADEITKNPNLISLLLAGHLGTVALNTLSLFNPFAVGWIHFAFSAVFYVLLLGVWTYCGSTITRLTALQYARDDIPTLNDALEMVRKKRKAFYFAPLTPLIGVFLFGLCSQLAGLVGSIPWVGPWILAVLIPFAVLPGTIVLVFIAVLGVLSFGLMMPAISIGGKDAFEGWSSAYSYLLWGFNKFISYSVLALILGVISIVAAAGISELFILILNRTLSIGLIEGDIISVVTNDTGIFRLSLLPVAETDIGLQVASWVTVIIALIIRLLVPAFAFSYLFTSNTIICFLMRKHVDKIEVDEVYYEEESIEDESEEGEVDEDDISEASAPDEQADEKAESDEMQDEESTSGNAGLSAEEDKVHEARANQEPVIESEADHEQGKSEIETDGDGNADDEADSDVKDAESDTDVDDQNAEEEENDSEKEERKDD